MSGYHADTPITIKAEPSIWPTAADHEPACMCHLYRLRIKTHVLTQIPCIVLSRDNCKPLN